LWDALAVSPDKHAPQQHQALCLERSHVDVIPRAALKLLAAAAHAWDIGLSRDGDTDEAEVQQLLDEPCITAKPTAAHPRDGGDVAHAKLVAAGLGIEQEQAADAEP
jgi:hypothetical protein